MCWSQDGFTTVLKTSEFWWCELGLFIFTKFKLKRDIFKHKSTQVHIPLTTRIGAHHTSRNLWKLLSAHMSMRVQRQLISKHCYGNNSLSESIHKGTPRGHGPHFEMCQSRVWPCGRHHNWKRGYRAEKRRKPETIYVNTEITRSMLEVGLE